MTAAIERDTFVVDEQEFAKAGLADPGSFLFRVEAVKGTMKKYGEGPDAEEFPIIQMKLAATHTVETDEEGNVTAEVALNNVVNRNYEEFKLKGKSARKLRTLYQAVTGRPLTGLNEDGQVDLLAAAEELIGGSAWNNVFHASYTRDDNTVGWKDMLTNTFKSRAPKFIKVRNEDEG